MAQQQLAWSINESTITCVADGQVYTIQRDHPEARQILRAIKEKADAQHVIMLFNKIKAMASYMQGSVEVRGNAVFCNGVEVHNVVAERILKFMGDGLPHEPLVAFLGRLAANPSKRSVDQLYTFLEHKNLPITPDGKFLAYKAVQNNWKDKHSGKFSNRVGCTLSMPRNNVDDNPDAHCSCGFHVGSIDYVRDFACGYGSPGGDRIVIVEVDPAAVVSVPRDCSCQKVRTCKYKVVAEYTGALPEGLVRDPSNPYQDADKEDYDDGDVDWDGDDGIEYPDPMVGESTRLSDLSDEEQEAYKEGYRDGLDPDIDEAQDEDNAMYMMGWRDGCSAAD